MHHLTNRLTQQLKRMTRARRAPRLHRAERVFRSLRLSAGAFIAAGALSLALLGAQSATVAQAAPVTINTHNVTLAAQTSSTSTASWLYYKRGYYLDNGWLCYGWANGAYHCTQHWHWANGQLVSDNPAWVPNYGTSTTSTGSSGSGSHVDGDGDYDNDTSDNGSSGSGSSGSGGTGATGGSGGGSVASMIQSAFGSYAGAALRVATCESSLNPGAYNASSGASGVFQFLHSTWLTTSYAGYSPFNAWANINAAHQVFVRDGYSWREWQCQP